MFGFITDTIESAVNVVADTGLFLIGEGDGPSRRDVAQALAGGLSVYAVAEMFNVAESAVQAIAESS